MREIKFRVWDTENHSWLVVKDKQRIGLGLVVDANDTEKLVCFKLNARDAVLMQYTGLKDKNGREIYEGDILSFLFFEDTKPRIEEVIWINENAGFGFPLGLCGLHDIEVIGNIYENPELLEDK